MTGPVPLAPRMVAVGVTGTVAVGVVRVSVSGGPPGEPAGAVANRLRL